MGHVHRERLIPQRARREGIMPLARHLPVEARIGLEKALVGERPVEMHLPVGADFGLYDHRGQHIIERAVEIARDRAGQHTIERHPAYRQ